MLLQGGTECHLVAGNVICSSYTPTPRKTLPALRDLALKENLTARIVADISRLEEYLIPLRRWTAAQRRLPENLCNAKCTPLNLMCSVRSLIRQFQMC